MWQIRQVIISRSEPELGTGAIVDIDQGANTLKAYFGKTQEKRRYSLNTAPLQRFIMEAGQQFFDAEGTCHTIETLTMDQGIVIYHTAQGAFPEDAISPKIADQGNCLAQLFSGQLSDFRCYDLRREAWALKSASHRRHTLGLEGARVTPMPHQLYIAATVARRARPRAIIADEVGLGKTIEAGLIFSTLRALGKADRVLILAPDSLVNQWVAELYRKFGEVFAILDAPRCQEEEASQAGLSPFQTNQRVIVSHSFFTDFPERRDQALMLPWDLVIIDEAHHLRWDEETPNSLWQHAEALSKISHGLLLLTATPQHYGLDSQFGMLRLLDPERYQNCDDFCAETDHYRAIAELAKAITQQCETLPQLEVLRKLLSNDPTLLDLLASSNFNEEWRRKVLAALLDRFGTGRLVFRNRREKLKGFPRRILASYPLNLEAAQENIYANLNPQTLSERELISLACGHLPKLAQARKSKVGTNPRLPWLLALLDSLRTEKILLLCSSKDQVRELGLFFDEHRKVNYAVFHEDLTLLERDKQAAKFVADDGAQVLIASEIGGEGRNFQCARHLILMDLPRSPDLLEQRIGRLDRIGQAREITIHVPWLKDTPEEALFTWYEQGLKAFAQPWASAHRILDHSAEDLLTVFQAYLPLHPNYDDRHHLLARLVESTREQAEVMRQESQRGEEFLLDLNSFDETKGTALLTEVEDGDDDTSVEFFMRNVFQHYGVDFDEYDDRGSLVVHGDSLMFLEKFPGIDPEHDTLITFDREVALAREDMLFLSSDHPLVESSMALLLERNEGAASICQWQRSPLGRSVLLECSFVLEAQGPRELELNRYLPICCKEIILNHQGKNPGPLAYKKQEHLLSELRIDGASLLFQRLPTVIPELAKQAEQQASAWAQAIIADALAAVDDEYTEEHARLRYLAQVNPSVSAFDLGACEQRYQRIIVALNAATVRLDGVRLIFNE